LTEELGGDIKNPLGLNQAEIIAGLSLELIKSSKRVISPLTQQPFPVKIGFHSGSAVGGIVGAKNFQYCLFGDTINTASRITTTGEAGRVHVSDTSYALLRESPYFEIQSKGKTELKGKGTVETYWLVGPKADYMAAAEQDPFRIHEESQSAVGQHQANMYENTAIQKLDPDKTRNGSPPVHRANMARRPSIASGTCPFSGQQLGNKPK
ncbi:unnamed protein product, partial [Rotaria socialis]